MTQTTALKTSPLIEILHLDEMGYGPNGAMTRREWRKVCLDNLLAGKEQFEAWQRQISQDHTNGAAPSFDLRVDGIIESNWNRGGCNNLDFAGHVFEQDLKAIEFEFLLPFNFHRTIFARNADFSNVRFQNANFFSNIFYGNVNFSNTKFFGHFVNFNKTIFSSQIDFSKSEFPSNFTDFNNINFNESEFRGHANFENLIFQVKTSFNEAKFYGGANFKNCQFEEGCSFKNAKFLDKWSNSLWQKMDLQSVMSTSLIDFQNVSFKNGANFNKAVFELVTQFTQAEFLGDAEFNKTKFYQDIRFFDTKFKWGAFFNNSEFCGDAVKRLGQMKVLTETFGATEQALNFNALELRAQRLLLLADAKKNQEKWWSANRWQARVTGWYDMVSDFGRSFLRPLGAYLALLAATWLLALGHAAFYNSPKDCKNERWWLFSDLARLEMPCNQAEEKAFEGKLQIDGYRAASEYTLFRAAGVLDFSDTGKQTDAVARRLFGQPIEPWWMRIWGVFKAIASTALLFLAALGLRNKYRIK